MEGLTFLELAKRVLEEEKKPLSVDEVWKLAKSKGLDQLLRGQGKTPWATLGALLHVNVRDRKDTVFATVGARPKRFYLKGELGKSQLQSLESGQIEPQTITKSLDYFEKDLHPFLAYYANLYLKAYTKTIHHSRSDKRQFGEWIHPDMVGCCFPDWEREVIEFGSRIGNVAIKMFSFELKKELTFDNLRESFFQTVSNSTWAHEGYLVAAEVLSDEDFRAELQRLSISFGIGIIQLSLDDPNSSEILFPARTRENLDLESINKLTAMNPDFKEFLSRIYNDISTKEIREEKYDKVLDRDALVKSIRR
ncbi:MAG: HTH domain-containing protein [Verrucomicrobiota bacterium]|jgi:hypothetical protein